MILIPFLMAILSRYCGTSHKGIGSITIKAIAVLPFLLFGVFAYAGALLAKITGHGRGQSLKEPFAQADNPEKIELFTGIYLLQNRMSVYWYKILILTALGAVSNLPGSIVACFTGNALVGIILGVGAASMPLAYAIGWSIPPKILHHFPKYVDDQTSIGEFLTGFFQGMAIYLALSV